MFAAAGTNDEPFDLDLELGAVGNYSVACVGFSEGDVDFVEHSGELETSDFTPATKKRQVDEKPTKAKKKSKASPSNASTKLDSISDELQKLKVIIAQTYRTRH